MEVPNRVSSVSHAITREEVSVLPVSARASPGGVDACLHTKHRPALFSARVMIEDSITVTVVCHGGRGLEGQQKEGGENLDVHHDEEVIIMKAPWMVSREILSCSFGAAAVFMMSFMQSLPRCHQIGFGLFGKSGEIIVFDACFLYVGKDMGL